MILEAIPLEGRFVRLEPFRDDLKTEVFDAIGGCADDWAIMSSNGCGAAFEAYWDSALADLGRSRRIPFAIRRRSDGRVVGTTSFIDPNARHRPASRRPRGRGQPGL
jgi:hypothetical protein